MAVFAVQQSPTGAFPFVELSNPNLVPILPVLGVQGLNTPVNVNPTYPRTDRGWGLVGNLYWSVVLRGWGLNNLTLQIPTLFPPLNNLSRKRNKKLRACILKQCFQSFRNTLIILLTICIGIDYLHIHTCCRHYKLIIILCSQPVYLYTMQPIGYNNHFKCTAKRIC